MTIDVEDFYEGMSVLGHEVERPPGLVDKLDRLVDLLGAHENAPKVTLFVVGHHAAGGRGPRGARESLVRQVGE